MLTKQQIEQIISIIRHHMTWMSWRILGQTSITEGDLEELRLKKLLPLNVNADTIKDAYVLGRLESILKLTEFKKLTWTQVLDEVAFSRTPIDKLQIDAANLSAKVVLRNLSRDIEDKVFQSLADEIKQTVTEATVKDIVKDKIKMAVAWRKTYDKVGDDLADTLKDKRRNWRRVATTEIHAARQKGYVNSIIQKTDIHEYSEGKDSNVAVVPSAGACDECLKRYLDPKTGRPKIFKLSDLLANEGTNYIKPWRKNAKPVIPPLHPNCFCSITRTPRGWGFDDRWRLIVEDPKAYRESLDEAVKSIRKSQEQNHQALLDSLEATKIPTVEEINQIEDPKQLWEMADRFHKLAGIHYRGGDMYDKFMDLEHAALYRVFMLHNGRFADEAENAA